jgi:hypothetical protein
MNQLHEHRRDLVLQKRETSPPHRVAGSLTALSISTAELLSLAFGVSEPLHPLLTLGFLLTCPGLVLLDLARLPDAASRLVIVLGASLAFNIILTSALLVADVWSAAACIGIAGLVTSAMASIQAWRATAARRKARCSSPASTSRWEVE